MQVAKNAVVLIDYTLRNPKGEVLDTSVGKGDGLAYIHGTGNLIPGLEKALEGKSAGDKIRVTVNPEEGYGNHDPQLIQVVPKTAFQGVPTITVGIQFRPPSPGGGGGPSVVTVTKREGETVTVDGNHALAGMALDFEVTIKSVRAATKEELAHGHVHGPGGHHHH